MIHRALAFIVACSAGLVLAQEGEMPQVVPTISAGPLAKMQAQLLALAGQQLAAQRLFVDAPSARFTWSKPPRPDVVYEVTPLGSVGREAQRLPLRFSLRPAGSTVIEELQVSLAVHLQQDVLVASRRLPRGEAVSCDDVEPQRIDSRRVPRDAIEVPCAIGTDSVALRHLAARDLVRSSDLGAARAVLNGAPVRVRALAGPVEVVAPGTALGDGRVGEWVRVRMTHPHRIVAGEVTDVGQITLNKEAP